MPGNDKLKKLEAKLDAILDEMVSVRDTRVSNAPKEDTKAFRDMYTKRRQARQKSSVPTRHLIFGDEHGEIERGDNSSRFGPQFSLQESTDLATRQSPFLWGPNAGDMKPLYRHNSFGVDFGRRQNINVPLFDRILAAKANRGLGEDQIGVLKNYRDRLNLQHRAQLNEQAENEELQARRDALLAERQMITDMSDPDVYFMPEVDVKTEDLLTRRDQLLEERARIRAERLGKLSSK